MKDKSVDKTAGRGRARVMALARALFSVTIVGLLIRHSNPAELALRPDARLFVGFAVAVGLIILALFFSAVRWRLVLGSGAPSSFALWRLYMIGWFFSLFLPTSVGGDAARTVALVRSGVSGGAGLSSVVLERLLGVVALLVLLAVGVAVSPETPMAFVESLEWTLTWVHVAAAAGGLAVAAAVLVPLAARNARVRGLTRDAATLVLSFRQRPRELGMALLASMMVQGLYICTWVVLAWAVRLGAPTAPFLVYVPFISIAAMLPVSLAGLGLREGAWVLLLAPLGIATATAVSFSLLYYAAGLVVGVGGAAFFFTSGLRTQLDTEEVPDDGRNIRESAAAHAV